MLCRKYNHIEISVAESRETLSRLMVMLERFASWIAKERARGKLIDIHAQRDTAAPE